MEDKRPSTRGRSNVPSAGVDEQRNHAVPSIVPRLLSAPTIQDLGRRAEFFGYLLGFGLFLVGLGCLISAIGNENGLLLGFVGILSLGLGVAIGFILVTLGRYIQWSAENCK